MKVSRLDMDRIVKGLAETNGCVDIVQSLFFAVLGQLHEEKQTAHASQSQLAAQVKVIEQFLWELKEAGY